MSQQQLKTLHVHFRGNNRITLKYYATTPQKDILKTIFKLFYLFDDHSWKQLKRNYMFQDTDGDTIMFDPISMPNETSVYLCFIDVLLGRQPLPVTPWKWDSQWNDENCGYKLSSDGLIIECPDQINRTQHDSMAILISDRSFTSGKHEWTVIWREKMMYHAAGLVSSESVALREPLKQFGANFLQVPWFHATSCMGKRKINIKLDMDKREAMINGKRHVGLPAKVYAGICFKMPHKMHATLVFE